MALLINVILSNSSFQEYQKLGSRIESSHKDFKGSFQ